MRWCAHGQHLHDARTLRLRDGHAALHRRAMAGNDHLPRRIEVRGFEHLALRRLGADFTDLRVMMTVGPTAAAGTTQIHVRDFTLDPKDIAVTGTVSLSVTNDGPTVHNVSIRDASGKVVAATKDLTQGQSEALLAKIPGGSYTLFCSLPGHESLGIKGTLTVSQ